MARLHLTDLALQCLKPRPKQYEVYDTHTRNFGVRVSPGGTKTFFAIVGAENARTRRTVGHYPAITLKDARRAAARLDPHTTTIPSFKEAREHYLREVKITLRPRSYEEAERHLNSLNLTSIELTLPIIQHALDGLPPSVANHRFQYLKTFLNWCDASYRTGNPLRTRQKPHKQPSRDRVLGDDELRAIFRSCAQLGTYGRLVRFLMLSGQRRNEVANIQRAWIKDSWLTIPAAYTKNGHEHHIPLVDRHLELLGTAPLAFPNDEGKPFNGWSKPKKKLDALSGVTGWRLHDLRRTWSSLAAKSGIAPHITERLLNHRTSTTETEISRVYNRYDFAKEKQEAMERVLTTINAIIES